MSECNKGEDKTSLPAQQTEQPQPLTGIQNDGWGARAGSLFSGIVEGEKQRGLGGNAVSQTADPGQARFTAGVVHFYEAILKEPIPERMLRLIEEIARQERKS